MQQAAELAAKAHHAAPGRTRLLRLGDRGNEACAGSAGLRTRLPTQRAGAAHGQQRGPEHTAQPDAHRCALVCG